MKRNTETEQRFINEGRDLFHAWALAEPEQRDEYARSVAVLLQRLGSELPRRSVLPLFIGSAAFAAVVSLARKGRSVEAGELIDYLEKAAHGGASVEGATLLAQLRRDLATYYSGNTDDSDGRAFMASALAAFRL